MWEVPWSGTPVTQVEWLTMSMETAANIRQELEAERGALLQQLQELGFGEGSSLTYDPNFADTSQVTAERGEAAALAQSLQEALEEVNVALEKITKGTFGACERCGKEIPLPRLEAKPTARLCITCASSGR